MTEAPSPVPFDVLLRHRDFLRSLARTLVADPNLADDVEQETWLEAMRSPPRDASSPRGWLATVARNAARKLGRGGARRTRYEKAVPPRDATGPADDLVAEAEVGRRLIELVLALEEPYRGTVLLRWFDGLEPAEIASRTGVPVETVRTRLKRAVARLRDAMDERHRGDREAWAVALVGPGWARIGKGIAMGAAKKATIAAAVLLAIGAVVWQSWPTEEVPVARSPDPAPTTTAAVSAEPHRSKPAEAAATAAAVEETPVDPILRVDPKSSHRVTVRTADGATVAGAVIELFVRRELNPTIPPEMRARFGEIPAPDAQYTTGADGVALLPKLPYPMSGTMIVRRKGFALAAVYAGETEIVLRPGCVLAGRVVDVRGRAVGGAPVAAGNSRTSGWSGRSAQITTTNADADGRFTLSDLATGTVTLFACWPGGSPTKCLEVVTPGARDVIVTIPGGGTIEGKVTEAGTGAPVEGAIVSISQNGSNSPVGPAFASTTTGADGTYRIEHFAADTWDEARASKPGWFEPPRGSGSSANLVPFGGAVTIDLVLARGGRVTGRVLGPDGPVASAVIAVIGANDGRQSFRTKVRSGADGRYAVDLPAGRAAFAVQAQACVQEGWSDRWVDDFRAGNSPVAATVEVPAGKEMEFDLVLVAGLSVSGIVLGEDGAPVPDRRVELRYFGSREQDGPRGWDNPPSATTGADGRFVVRGVQPDSNPTATSWVSGGGGGSAKVVVGREDVRDVEIRLKPPTSPKKLHVQVVWPDGAAPRDAVWLFGDWSGWMKNSGNRDNAFVDATAHVVPADGRFDVPVTQGREASFVVRVVATGFAPADTPVQSLAKDATEASVEIRPLRASASRLKGRVVAKGGVEGVPGALVRLRAIDPSRPPPKDEWYGNASRPVIGPAVASTDANGAFDVEGLAPGKYDVQVTSSLFEWWKGTVEVPSETLVVEVARLGTFAGRVRFADGAAAEGVVVRVDGPRDTYRGETRTDADGRFRLDDVPGGGLTIWAYGAFDGSGANIRQQQLKGWQHAGEDVDVVVERALSISGKIVDAAGAPVLATAILRTTLADGKPGNEGGASRGDGSFEIRGLAPGRYGLKVELYPVPGQPQLRCDPVDGVEAGTTGVTLVARSGLSIAGAVVVPPEAAKSAVRVLARKPEFLGQDATRARDVSGTLDSQGRFRIDGLDAGRWRIVFQDDQGLDSAWQAGDAAIAQAGDADVRVALSTGSTISGRVVFDGAPMQNCRIVVIADGDERVACTAYSWFEGKFTFVGLDPSKRWSLSASSQGLALARADGVTVGTTGLELVLTHGLDLKGRLLRADGTAAGRTSMRLETTAGRLAAWISCNDKGEIDAHAVPEGEFTVKAYVEPSKEGEQGTYAEIGRVRAGDTNVELRLLR